MTFSDGTYVKIELVQFPVTARGPGEGGAQGPRSGPPRQREVKSERFNQAEIDSQFSVTRNSKKKLKRRSSYSAMLIF